MKDAKKSHTKTYVAIWAVLAILTVIEIAAAQYLTGVPRWSSLVLLALAKAVCVAWWFMHLKYERDWLRFIAVLPAIAGVYAVVLILEVGAR